MERYDAIVQSRTVRRPEQADAAVLALADGSALAVSIDCNGKARRRRPPQRDDRDRHRVRCEPRLRRRQAAGDDEQPQLRQPREAPHRLAADRGRGRPGRGLPGARGADRRRQRLALQRGRRRPDRPDARDRHGRAPARRPGPGGRGSPSRATRSPSSGPSRRRSPPPSSQSSAASPCPTASRRWSCPRSSRGSRPSAAPSELGRSWNAHDIAEGGLAVALAESCLAGGIGAQVRLDECSRVSRGRPVRRGPRGLPPERPGGAARAARRARARQADRRARRPLAAIELPRERLELALAELEAAHGGGLEDYFA